MEYIIKNRHPESVFRFFEEISTIPRGSYHEKAIADYLVQFAKSRELSWYRDASDNVLIRKPASRDREQSAPILFQGHTDMVCEKNSNAVHDFLKDPLSLYIDGDCLRAKGTTLGADDGIAVAMMLALLDDEIKSHPAYECLFTTAEEVGLDGARSFDYSQIKARCMINLDSEELGIVTAGCAGGVRSDLELNYQTVPFSGTSIRVEVTGLMGGHSGENINSGRANANRLMGRLLNELISQTDARLIQLSGGSKDNAIPRESCALLSVPDFSFAQDLLTDAASRIASELADDDRQFCMEVSECEPEAYMLSDKDTKRAVAVLTCTPIGVLEMSKQVKGLVEYSRNLGIVKQEEGRIIFVFSSRSSIENQLDATQLELDLFAELTGCKTNHHSRYPGWSYSEVSPLRDAYCETYSRVTGQLAKVNVIHAGLECGIIHSKLPDMDMISIGPTMHDIHSPNEALELTATETFWKVLDAMIQSM